MTTDEVLDDVVERIRMGKDALYEEYEKQVHGGGRDVFAEGRLLGKIAGLALAQDYLRAYRDPAT